MPEIPERAVVVMCIPPVPPGRKRDTSSRDDMPKQVICEKDTITLHELSRG